MMDDTFVISLRLICEFCFSSDLLTIAASSFLGIQSCRFAYSVRRAALNACRYVHSHVVVSHTWFFRIVIEYILLNTSSSLCWLNDDSVAHALSARRLLIDQLPWRWLANIYIVIDF